MARETGFDPDEPGHHWDAVLLDIDHTPFHLLNANHADFHSTDGLRRLKWFLKPGGVFALWCDNAPDASFLERVRDVFGFAEDHIVTFDKR